jgi:hypothetical protein
MRVLLIVVVLAVGAYFGAKLYIQHKAANDLDSMLAQVQPFADVKYGSVAASMNGELSVHDVTVRFPEFHDPLKIDAVILETPGFFFLLGFGGEDDDFEVPDHFGIELAGLRAATDADYLKTLDELSRMQSGNPDLTPAEMCTSADGLSPAALRSVGYTEVVTDLRFAFRRTGRDLELEFAMHSEDMYDVDLAMKLADLADPSTIVRGARPKLIEARLDYVDRSLHSRIIKHCTEVHGVSVDAMIAAQLDELKTLARESGIELDAMILEPYTEFISGKQRFTVTATPPRPVDLTQIGLYKPSDVPNLLNLMAEAR